MPFTSTQVSGLVGGQQVMFANQAAFANQITGMMAGGPQQAMSNPFPSPSYGVAGLDPAAPDMGTKVAGGMSMAIPGIGAGGAMAASMFGYGNPLGMLDPFTGVTRAFGAGTGGGMMARAGVMATGGPSSWGGIGYGASNISGAFARGGLRAGLGALGGGLAGAAVAAVPYYVAGKALEYGAENLYEGVQNFQDVRRMSSQYFDPQYGQPGARLGGRMGAGQIKQMTSFMHELAGEDVQTTMKDMRGLMDRAGQMGMLQGIGDINQFKQRFRDIVRQTRGIAQILGATLEEALPVTQKLQTMGMWTARDIIGTAAAIKAAGPGGAPAMMGSMEQGAQMSHAMGGRLEAGARLGQELFTQVGAAVRAGVFSQQDVRNITGGVGGAEGQRMMAGNMQQVFAGFGQTAMGRLMMAGLGEMKQGEFTGRMDEGLLAKFRRGEIDVQELQARGQGRINQSKTAAVSFFNRADELGQEMAQKGGMVGMAQGVQQAMVRAGYAGESAPIQNRFIQLITGSNQRQADMIQKLIQKLPEIQAETERANEAALEDSFRQLDERRNRSLAGLKDAVSAAMHEGVARPIQELGENLTTSMGEATERASDWITGRTQALPRLGVEQRFMMAQAISGGAKFQTPNIQNVGQSFMQGDWMGNLIAGIGEEGFGSRVLAGAAKGGAVGMVAPIYGPAVGSLIGGAAAALGVGDPDTPRMRQLRAAGLTTNNPADAERVARSAYIRQADPTMSGLFGGEDSKKRNAMEKVKARMREIYNDRSTADRLAGYAKEDPSKQRDEILKLLRADPKSRDAMRLLEGAASGGEGSIEAGLSVIAGAQAELGYKGEHALDLTKLTAGLPIPPTDPEEVKKYRQENIEKMSETLGGFSWKGLAGAAAAGGLLGGPLAPIGAIAGAAVYGATRKMTPAEIDTVMRSKEFSSQDIKDYFTGKGGGRFAEALSKGDTPEQRAAQKLKRQYESSSKEEQETLLKQLDVESGVQGQQYQKDRSEKMAALAKQQGTIYGGSGVGEDTAAGLEKARQAFATGDVTSGERMLEQVAGRPLGEAEVNRLLTGGAGAVGQQAGRLAAIGSLSGVKKMTGEDYEKFMGRLGMSGASFKGIPGLQERVNEMLSTGGSITGSEIKELQERLRGAAPGALGMGVGAKTPAQEAQEKYITAMTKFSDAVNKLAVVKAQDVKGDQPMAIAAKE
jgi:hypothetical protein